MITPSERRRIQRRARARQRQFRRRRIVALAGLGAVGAAFVSIVGGGGSGTAVHPPSAAARAARLAATRRAELAVREQRAIDHILTYTSFFRAGVPRKREVALTFDDGPGPYTPEVLRVLHRYHAPATFFAVGFMERWFAHSTASEVAKGYAIGDHTAMHRRMASLSAPDQRNELLQQASAIEAEGAPFPRLFRPPFGSFNSTTLSILHGLRMLMVLWSVDTGDFRRPGTKAIVANALSGAKPGAIILLHDAGGNRLETIAALPYIIRGLRHRHLRLVTIPRLALDDPPPAGQALPGRLAGD